MTQLSKHAKYVRAKIPIVAGFGVSGSICVTEGNVGEIINNHAYPDSVIVDLVGVGRRGMTIEHIEEITEKEYFKGKLKG
jgi:hypothetical protein